jgi:hypothetical protein
VKRIERFAIFVHRPDAHDLVTPDESVLGFYAVDLTPREVAVIEHKVAAINDPSLRVVRAVLVDNKVRVTAMQMTSARRLHWDQTDQASRGWIGCLPAERILMAHFETDIPTGDLSFAELIEELNGVAGGV